VTRRRAAAAVTDHRDARAPAAPTEDTCVTGRPGGSVTMCTGVGQGITVLLETA
jgi:hypothetical protein